MDLFEGLNRVPWSSLCHAYGPAADVPDMLRALAAPDAEEREDALGGLWGSVHHQGDVYDSTLAALPYLVAAAVRPDFPDRAGIIDLVASIGRRILSPEELRGRGGANAEQRARAAQQARAELLRGLAGYFAALADPEVQVRLAAADVLAACHEKRDEILPVLQAAVTAEREPRVQLGLIDAGVALAARDPGLARQEQSGHSGQQGGPLERWLVELCAPTQPPHIRLAALSKIVTSAPHRLPADVPATARALVEEALAEQGEPAQDRSADISSLSLPPELDEDEDEDWRTPLVCDLLGSLYESLDERVGDRIRLIVGELAAPRDLRRGEALRAVRWLMRDLRHDYTQLVREIGDRLSDPEPYVGRLAVSALEDLGVWAAPAADALAILLADAPREGEQDRSFLRPSWIELAAPGPPAVSTLTRILAATRDRRALPILRWCLELEHLPRFLGAAIAAAGPVAAELAQAANDRLGALPARPETSTARKELATALGEIGPAAACAVPHLLAMLGESETRFTAATALGRIGPVAATAACDPLERLLEDPDPLTVVTAASALARINPDNALLLPALLRCFTHPSGRTKLAAAEALGLLADTSCTPPPLAAQMLEGSDPWDWLAGALVRWYTSRDARAAVPALARAWEWGHHTRRRIARHAATMGPQARALEGLLRAELAAPRRHNRPPGSPVFSSVDIPADEELLVNVRRALHSIAGH